MQQDLDRQVFDEYYNFLHSLSSIVSDFCFISFSDKEAAFKSALSLAPAAREALSAKDHNFTQFLITLIQELGFSIAISFADEDTPTESLLSKLIEYTDFKLEFPPSGKPKINLSYKKLSAVVECLSLILELAKNDTGIYDIVRSSTNLAIPIIRLLKAIATDVENPYNTENIQYHILLPKQMLWTSLEQLLAEGSLYHVFGCISKDAFKEFFELMELNNREYAENARDILKKLSKVGQNNALFSKLSNYLDEKKCLLSLWRSLKFHQERQTFPQKEAFLKYIIDNFSTGTLLQAPFISYDILNEVLLFLDLDLLSVLLSCTGESQDNVNYLQILIDTVNNLSQYPLYIYGSAVEASNENLVLANLLPKGGHPNRHVVDEEDLTLKNCVFYKVLFDVIIKTSQDKKTWSWHYFLKEMNTSLLQCFLQSPHNYNILETTLKPFKFLVKTIHTCENGCIIHSMDILDYLLTQVHQRNIEDDIFLLSVHLEKIKDMNLYVTLIDHILMLCQSNKKVLTAFSKDIHFLETIVNKLLSYIKQENSQSQISLDFARTICSLILLLIEQNKKCLDTIAKLSLIKTMLTSFQNNDENGDLQGNFIFFVNNILLLDLQCREKFSNIGQACSTLKGFQKKHLELTKNIFETFRHLKLHLDKVCMRKLVKEFELFDLVLELLEINFKDICVKDSEFYYIWDLLLDFLSTSNDVASYFSCKLQGFIKIVNFAKKQGQQDKIIQQLLLFSLYSPDHPEKGYVKIQSTIDLQSYANLTIKYPRLFREIYHTLISQDQTQYIDFLNQLLTAQPLNYKILNTCDFVEYLHKSHSNSVDLIFDLALRFFENAHSLSTLQVLSKYFIDENQLESSKDKSVLEAIEKKLAIENQQASSISLKNDSAFDYQLLWVPKIHIPHSKHEENPNHALTFFTSLKLDHHSQNESFTLFTLMSKSGNQHFKVYLNKQALTVQFKEQEIIVDPQFLNKITPLNSEFTLALAIVAPNHLNPAVAAKQDTFLSFYLNGTLLGDFAVKLNPTQSLFADNHYQLVIGSTEESKQKSTLHVQTFWMLKRSISIQEALSLHALTLLMGSSPNSLTSDVIKFEFSKLGKQFSTEKLPFDFNLDKAIAFYSEATFSENIFAEVAWSNILQDAVLIFSAENNIQRLENSHEVHSFLKEVPHLPSQTLIKNFHDKELLAFIPNLVSAEELGSHAFLMGFTHEKDINDYNSIAHELASKSLVKILEESDFLQVLLVKFLNSIRENNSQIIKDILAILISLYKKSQKARQYLIESNFLSFACNAFETAQNSQEQEHLLQIYQDLFIDINSNKDILLYSINAFKKIYESLDILASANNLVQTFGLNLLEKHLLKEDNKFFRWNIKSLREIQFAQMLINGLLVGRYTNISDNIYKIISILLWYRDDQCADLDCVSYIGDALGFLYFASGNTTNLLSPAKNKNFVAPFDDFDGKKEESKENQEDTISYFNRKYLTLARQDLSYAQGLYQKLLATIIDLLVETTMRPLNIQLISLLLNIVFCYGDYDSHYKIITILFSYIPRFWQTGYEYNEEDDTDSEDESSPSPGLPNPAKSIWKAITTKTNFLMKNNNAPKSEEGQLKKTKSREKFLKGLNNYLKALLLIHGYNIETKDATKLGNYLNMLGIHAETLFEPTYQEDAFLNCLLYQLLIYLISDGETRIKDKALAVMCCMLVHSKDPIKKALTYEKINLFDLGFQNLLKNKSNTSVILYSNFAQFITERTPTIQTILSSKLGSEWNKFTEQIRLTFEAGLPKQGQSQAVILKDSPYHHHTILLPHLYLPSVLIKAKTKNIPLISFFGKQDSPPARKQDSINNLDYAAGSEISVSQKAVKERFDRAYVSLQYQNKCKRLAALTRENEIDSFLKRNKKKTFISSLQNTTNVAEITLTNYSWHLDTKNYPKGQRLKLQLKEHHTDKSQYERSPLKKPPSLSDQDLLILPSDNVPVSQDNPKPRKRFLSASGRGSLKMEGEVSSDDLFFNLQKVPNKEGSLHSLDEDEVLKMVEEVQSQTGTFRYNSVNRELDINEVINSKYNCLFIDMQEKAECVFIVGRCSLYICTNYQLNKHGDIREVEPLDEKTITRLKWITPVKKEKLRKGESLSDLEEDEKQNYRSRSRSSFSELDQDYSDSKPKIIRIPLEKILEVHARRYLLYPNAIEIFLDSGKSYFLAFNISFRNHCFTDIINAHAHYFNPNIDKLEVTLPKDTLFFASLSPELLSSKKKNAPSSVKIVSSPRFYIHSSATLLKQAVNLWVEGEISNFDYLMLLNTLSGRTLADLAQHPVFPWVIQQYQGESFKYSRKENYRPLAAPIGAMTPDRIDTVKKRFLETKESIMMSPYHYGSHYSSPGIMMYYFIRMFPFSQFSAHLQGGRFDFPNRLFSNIQSTFNLAQSIDFKELTPEFYTLPEFLVNLNRFHFGSAQEGILIHHVVTAQWAKNNPRHFVQTMRRALESENSSRNINEWIDLIFGYKQRDKKAEEYLNLYHAITYEGVINLEGNNEFELECFLTQINEFGQCPKKLFDASHPQRKKMPHNSSFFSSKEHLRHCTFVSLRDPIDHSINRNHQLDRIKLKNDEYSLVDSNQKCRVGLGSFQAIPSLDEPETETVPNLKQNLMFAHKGYLLRGGKDNQLINWNNPYKGLLLYSFEKDRNVIRTFNSSEFEDITCAEISKDGQLLILGNKFGRLTTFSFREQTLNNHILANPTKKKSSSKKKTESQVAKSSANSEEFITKIRPEIQSEWAVEGIEVKDEKIKHSIFGSVVNKKKHHLEDFRGSKIHRRSSKDANPKDDEVAFVSKYCKIHRSTEDESKDKTIKLIMENCVPEAHNGAITAIQVSKSWNLMITADNKGICKVWDLNKSKLVKEIYTYHFKDSEIFDVCNSNIITENEDYMTTYLKQTTEREKVKSIVISESNGDFCVVSSHYVSVYTINGVLVSTFSTKQNKLPPLKSALLTRSQYSYEESCLILGHKKGLLTFWIFKENARLKNLKEVKQINQQDDVLAGKYGHYYDMSTFINKAIPLNNMVKIFESEVPSVVHDHHIDLNITSLAISADQTKLLVAINTGEIFCFKKPIDASTNQNKTCGWCSTSIGLVDARIICAVCQKTFCINCSTLEESVNSAHLWKKVRLCPQCSVQSNSKSTDTLYDFY